MPGRAEKIFSHKNNKGCKRQSCRLQPFLISPTFHQRLFTFAPSGDEKDEKLGCFSNVRGRLKFMHPITKHGKFFLEKIYIRRNIIGSLQSSIN